MTNQPELNFDSVFRLYYTASIDLPTGEKRPVMLRSIGRSDGQRRRDYARQQADFVRRRLKSADDPQTVETFAWIGEATDEDLIFVIKEWFRARLAREAIDYVFLDMNEDEDLPDPETLVESLEKDEHLEDQKSKVAKLRADYVKENLPRRVENVIADRERMETMVRKLATENKVLEVHQMAWADATLFYGVLNPDGSRFFDEMPVDVDESLLEVLTGLYRTIDEGSYRPSS